ncbi:GNAT family N-acetyltransferase [Arenimonas sp. MALMAid1274]|uniref:GNAT family N-acetyltransferase n=1 Tax=Arenimonas sp. MALMAid1274 TaxID=3411630 RepID=UPI003BA297EC
MSAGLDLDFGPGRIRDWVRSDRASLLRHADDARVARFLSARFPHPYRTTDADAWFDFLAGQPEPEGWAIEVDGQAVGGIGVRRGAGEFAHSGELGYWLGAAYWRRGIVSAAVRVLVPAVMARWDLARVGAYAATANIASIRVLEGAGFEREGVMQARSIRGGEVQDHVVFARIDRARLARLAR